MEKYLDFFSRIFLPFALYIKLESNNFLRLVIKKRYQDHKRGNREGHKILLKLLLHKISQFKYP